MKRGVYGRKRWERESKGWGVNLIGGKRVDREKQRDRWERIGV